ncbi:Bacteriophage replication gene A protein (GPA) [Serratia quinivorans]|uniref:replication endonuclease n=1 Tax=Serratia quinivorans TaxID=137545 RepID=UPI00217A1794|nr:replication endonuclease [Serratia quinivorans]CAI1636702.1 Bacteriophage replication gene A protein (GPA) [Serratia quinivorans]
MTTQTNRNNRGRIAPSPPANFPGKPLDTRAYIYHWNAPQSAIDPALFGTERPVETPLSYWIAEALGQEKAREARRQAEYRASLSQLDRRRLALRDQLLRDYADREGERDAQIEANREKRQVFADDRDAEITAALFALPRHVKQPLLARLNAYRRQQARTIAEGGKQRPARKFLRGTIKRVIPRLEQINSRHQTIAYRYIAGRERLDELLRLPELSKREVQLLATLTAGAMESLFSQECEKHLTSEATPQDILRVYTTVAHETLRLNITPPCWAALDVSRRQRGETPYHLLPGALARLCCATWWQRKLWRYRCEWREEQLRAACLVSRTTSAYVSQDSLVHHREQRRRTREFLKAYELVNDDGFSIDMETIYFAGNSNPKHRRVEMMITVKGMQEIAETRSDNAFWFTITCPSKYHTTLINSGSPNPKWAARTVRDSSDYLVNLFAGVRKKLNRKGLRWYGVRVAEPHHDGTVHWHVMVFCRPEDQDAITDILREFAIREDRAELGDDITPRFKVEQITKEKGSPLSYIAAYIGKNIDGSKLTKPDPKTGEPPVDHESGKSMADTVEHAIAWASLHRVRQFQFFGIPSRQTYRELRRLAGQLSRQGKDGKKQQRLMDKAMDDVMSAADAGCIATYILKQGGILQPRKEHVVRTAYAEADKPNDYGEHGTQIFGIWSPQLGAESRICTHVDNWQRIRKAVKPAGEADRQGVDVDPQGGPAVPWTRGNNCPIEQKTSEAGAGSATDKEPENLNFEQLTRHQRRVLLNRIRNATPPDKKEGETGMTRQSPPVSESTPEDAINAALRDLGLTPEPQQVISLLAGDTVDCGDGYAFRLAGNRLLEVPAPMTREDDDETPPPSYRTGDVAQLAAALGIRLEPWEISALLRGATLDIGGGEAIRLRGDRLEPIRRTVTPF